MDYPNTLGGFRAVFYVENERQPTDQEIWDAGVRSMRQRLGSRIAELEAQLAESRANDRTAMGYLSDIRAIVGGEDFPDMVHRIAELEARQVSGLKPVPLSEIEALMSWQMDAAVANGANSVSMPDEIVAVAHFVAYPHEYIAAPSLANSGEVKP